MKSSSLILLLISAALTCTAVAQTPVPVVVQPAPVTAARVAPAAAVAGAPLMQSALKAVSDLRAANAEILKKQEATLLQISELEKAAEQIKVYTKRG